MTDEKFKSSHLYTCYVRPIYVFALIHAPKITVVLFDMESTRCCSVFGRKPTPAKPEQFIRSRTNLCVIPVLFRKFSVYQYGRVKSYATAFHWNTASTKSNLGRKEKPVILQETATVNDTIRCENRWSPLDIDIYWTSCTTPIAGCSVLLPMQFCSR